MSVCLSPQVVPEQICISIKEFQKLNGYRLTGLDPGNWTYQINAVSLAGNSSFTAEKYFIVPHSPGNFSFFYMKHMCLFSLYNL